MVHSGAFSGQPGCRVAEYRSQFTDDGHGAFLAQDLQKKAKKKQRFETEYINNYHVDRNKLATRTPVPDDLDNTVNKNYGRPPNERTLRSSIWC